MYIYIYIYIYIYNRIQIESNPLNRQDVSTKDGRNGRDAHPKDHNLAEVYAPCYKQ